MRWTVHGERAIYTSEWMSLVLVDVELPGGPRFEHHVMRLPTLAAGVVADDPDRGVLPLWRHRFITDSWGWELPAGRVDPGERPIEAAARETLEETGWRAGPLTALTSYHPSNGAADTTFHLFLATSAVEEGAPSDADESQRIEWLSRDRIRTEIAEGRVLDGISLTGLLYRLASP